MTQFCTNCGAPLQDEAAFCTNCGAPIEAIPEAIPQDVSSTFEEQQTTQIQEPEVVVTEQTFEQQSFDPTSVFATQSADEATPIQAPLIQTPVIQTPVADTRLAQAPKKSNTPLIIGIVIAAVVIIVAVVVAFFVFGGQKSSPEPSKSPSATTAPATTTCKVTFETNGGTTISQTTVDKGDTLASPKDPTRAGYTFAGWYLDSSLSKAASFPLKIESDTVLYAKWDNGKDATDVTLSVVGRDGSTRTATIHRDGKTGRIFPNSNTTALTESQVRALSDAERCIAWNEIIAAANGYVFKNSGLKNYFTDYCAWYQPSAGSNGTSNLSSTANKNIEMLKRYTDSWWLNLATN